MYNQLDNIYDLQLLIKKSLYQKNMYNVPSDMITRDIKKIVIESIEDKEILFNILDQLDNYDIEVSFENINSILDIYKNKVIIQSINTDYDLMNYTLQTYKDIENIIYESYRNIYDIESNYLYSILEAENNGNIAAKAVGTVAKTTNTIYKGMNSMWETLLNFLKTVKESFMSKYKKITERDSAWLKNNEKTLITLDTNNLEVKIHSDYNKNISVATTAYNNFKTIIEANINADNYEEFENKIKQFKDSNGDLKQGLMNRYRTGNSTKSYDIIEIRGNTIKTNVISNLISYCKEFINNYNTVLKNLKDSEAFIKRLQQQVKSRDIQTEGYCYIEDSLYCDTEFALLYNFNTVLEADETNNNEKENSKENKVEVKKNETEKSEKKEKVEVKKRDEVKEKTDKMSDNKLTIYNKICRDRHTGITAYMTATEKKYLESIAVLRGLLKNKE